MANAGGLAALSGWRVLLVDLDPQGNLARDLGYMDQSDGGAKLFAAAYANQPLEPIWDVRRGLDVIAGGPDTRRLGNQLMADITHEGDSALDRLGEVLTPLAANYDLVLLDLPPGEAVVQSAAMRFAHHLIIPTSGDAASMDGLGTVYSQYLNALPVNPDLNVLGIVITLVQSNATALLREITAELDDLLEKKVQIFSPPIRLAKRAAIDCRARGLLAHEYEAAKLEALPWYKAKTLGTDPQRFAENAAGLASDYQRLTQNILEAAFP